LVSKCDFTVEEANRKKNIIPLCQSRGNANHKILIAQNRRNGGEICTKYVVNNEKILHLRK